MQCAAYPGVRDIEVTILVVVFIVALIFVYMIH